MTSRLVAPSAPGVKQHVTSWGTSSDAGPSGFFLAGALQAATRARAARSLRMTRFRHEPAGGATSGSISAAGMTSGDTIGPYRLLAAIGRGAMGEVWRARDQRLDRLVAVKLLPPDLAG